MDNSVWVCVFVIFVNFGFGYDCIGLVLDLWDEVSVGVFDCFGVMIDVIGEGVDMVFYDEFYFVMVMLCQGLVELGYFYFDVGLYLIVINFIL